MPAAYRILPFLTLALVAAFGCSLATAADPLPKPDDLLAEYQALGLPLPPAKSRLIRYESGGGGMVNGVVQPTEYSLAIELQPGTKDKKPLLLVAAMEWRPDWDPKTRAVKPEVAAVESVDLGRDQALVLAIQYHSLGWGELSRALLEQSRPKEGNASPTDRLVALTWGYWYGRVTHPTADRAPVAKRLQELMKRDKTLDTDHHRSVLRSLELALVPGKAKPGSVEARIDALVNYSSNAGTIGQFEPGVAYWQLAEKRVRCRSRLDRSPRG